MQRISTREVIHRTTGYLFNDEQLLELCITKSDDSRNRVDYQRMEFLGDKVLNLAVSHLVFSYLPGQPEGLLTQIAEEFVKNGENMASIARKWKLDKVLRIGASDRLNGLLQNDRKLSDAVEALLGGIWLDSKQDFQILCKFVKKHWNISKASIEDMLESSEEEDDDDDEKSVDFVQSQLRDFTFSSKTETKQIASHSFTCKYCHQFVSQGQSMICSQKHHPERLEEKSCSNRYKCKLSSCSNQYPCKQLRYWYPCCELFVATKTENETSGCKKRLHTPNTRSIPMDL